LVFYEKLVKTNPKVERKGAANPYTSLNGHMFTYLNQSGSLALRLPEGKREKFLKKYKAALFVAYGAVMKEYATVPDKSSERHENSTTAFPVQLRIHQNTKTQAHEENEEEGSVI
jgi:hypothetical protein